MSNQKGFTVTELLLVLFIIGIVSIGPICWHWDVNTWLGWAHKPQTFGWFPSIVCAIVGCVLTIPLTVLTWIVTFFM